MLKLESVEFSYSNTQKVLEDLSIQVPKGSIYGFLGANGAGKTTTIRIILGLLHSASGEVSIDGLHYKSNFKAIYRNIGSLIEQTVFYGHLSGRDNLKVWSNYYKTKASRIAEVLEWVQLTKAANKKVKQYSQGMKRRLGIATALLHDPDLLVLDEPLNGLDPKGIAEMRALFLKLKSLGKTIFLSSHILSEIEASCDRLIIIDGGKSKFEGTVSELNDLISSDLVYQLDCTEGDRAYSILEQLNTAKSIKKLEDKIEFVVDSPKDISELIKHLVQNNIDILEVKKKEAKLEELYLKLTNSI